MIWSLLIILTAQLYSVQGEFGVILKDAVCPYYDPIYATEPETYVDDNNGIFFNFSLIKPFPSTVEGSFSLLGASMGEYVVDTGINVQMPLCEMLDEPIILGPLLQIIGLKDKCPPVVGVYGSESYTIPTSMFPEDFPPNQYKVAFVILNEGKEIMVIDVYVDIQ